MENTVWNSFFS